MDGASAPEQEAAQQPPQTELSPAAGTPESAKKGGGLFGKFFGRKTAQPNPSTEVSKTEIDQLSDTTEVAGLIPKTEVEENPEAMQERLRGELMRAVELQVEAILKRKEANGSSMSREDRLAIETEATRIQTEGEEMCSQLVMSLESARGTLGDFCKQVEGPEGRKAVVLLSPLTREVQTKIIKNTGGSNPFLYGNAEPLYTQRAVVHDIFFVNEKTVGKISTADADSLTLTDEGNPDMQKYAGKDPIARQQEAEQTVFRYRADSVRQGLSIAFNGGAESIPKQVYVAPYQESIPGFRQEQERIAKQNLESVLYSVTHPAMAYRTEGLNDYGTFAEPLGTNNNLSIDGGLVKVSTSYDIAAAFDISVADAKTFKGSGVMERRWLSEPTPNPVPAEPMSTPTAEGEAPTTSTEPTSNSESVGLTPDAPAASSETTTDETAPTEPVQAAPDIATSTDNASPTTPNDSSAQS